MRSGERGRQARNGPDAATGWLPQFCSAPTLFAVMVVAELVALVIVIAPEPQLRPLLPRLGLLSLYAQWLALLNAVVLCSLRAPLERLGARAGFVAAWAISVLVTALASAVICRMEQALGLGLGMAPERCFDFVLANATICALIAAALLRYLFVIEQWRLRVNATAKAQVDALQARIRPHFLFNSMNTIASLIRTRPAQAEEAVEDLADLFRAALGANDAHGTLGDELDLVERYLRIEGLRLGGRLRTRIDVAALPRDFALPRLLLQPLVENAIHHGIQPRADGGTIELEGRRSDGGLEIVVRNPLPPDAPPSRNGVALANIRARIGYHFGARAELHIEPGPEHYTVVVRLPETLPR